MWVKGYALSILRGLKSGDQMSSMVTTGSNADDILALRGQHLCSHHGSDMVIMSGEGCANSPYRGKRVYQIVTL